MGDVKFAGGRVENPKYGHKMKRYEVEGERDGEREMEAGRIRKLELSEVDGEEARQKPKLPEE